MQVVTDYLKTRISLPEMILDQIQELTARSSLPHYSASARQGASSHWLS